MPTRLLALRYGADLVWGPETVDRKILGSTRKFDPSTGCIDFIKEPNDSVMYKIHQSERSKHIFQLGSSNAELAVQAAQLVAADVAGVDLNCGCPKPFSMVI